MVESEHRPRIKGDNTRELLFSTLVVGLILAIFVATTPSFNTLTPHKIMPEDVRVLPHEGDGPFRRRGVNEVVHDLSSAKKIPAKTRRQYGYNFTLETLPREADHLFIPYLGGTADIYLNGIAIGEEAALPIRTQGQAQYYAALPAALNAYQTGINRLIIVMSPNAPYAGLPDLYFGKLESDIASSALERHGQRRHFLQIIIGGATLIFGFWGFLRSASSRVYAGLCTIAGAQLTLGLGSGAFIPLALSSGVVGGLYATQLGAVIWIFAVWPVARRSAMLGIIVASILSLGIALLALGPSNHPTIAPYFYDFMTSGTWPLLGAVLSVLWMKDLRASRITTAQLEARLAAQQAVIDAQEKALEDSLRAKGRMAERQRLTRDIHDGIGGQLLSLLVGVRDGDMSQAEIERDLQYGLNDLRLIVDSMDHFDGDLKAAFVTFRARATAQLGASNIALNWTQSDPFVAANFGPTAILNIYRLMQEVITNAIRHAGCDTVNISISCDQEDAELQIEISDNGVGYDSEHTSAAGQGLKNMEYRARSIGAKMTVSKRSAGGTLVKVTVPTERAAT